MKANRIQDLDEKHKEYSIIGKYPPFSLSIKKRTAFFDDVIREEDRVKSEWKDGNLDAFDRMFTTLEQKWEDDLEEARLYQKRYSDPKEAQKAGFKTNGIDPDDPENWDIPLEP